MTGLSAGLLVVAVPASLAAAFGGAYEIAAAASGLAWLALLARQAGKRRRPPVTFGALSQWQAWDEAILSGDLSDGAWERTGQIRRDGAR